MAYVKEFCEATACLVLVLEFRRHTVLKVVDDHVRRGCERLFEHPVGRRGHWRANKGKMR